MLSKREKIIILAAVVLIVFAGLLGAIYGSKSSTEKDFFIDAKIARDNQRAIDRQTLSDIFNSANSSSEAKAAAEKMLLRIVADSETEMIIEAMIKSKGFDDALVFITDASARVIIKANMLHSNQVNEIKNIVCRESGLAASKIIIQNKK